MALGAGTVHGSRHAGLIGAHWGHEPPVRWLIARNGIFVLIVIPILIGRVIFVPIVIPIVILILIDKDRD